MWLANTVYVLHASGDGDADDEGVAVLTGRFATLRRRDCFAWAFIACCVGQLGSLVLTGGCVLTRWERELRAGTDAGSPSSTTFLQEHIPFLPAWAVGAVPLLTLAALIGAAVQVALAVRRRGAAVTAGPHPGDPG